MSFAGIKLQAKNRAERRGVLVKAEVQSLKRGRRKVPSGEGERRAMGGYVPQYAMGARLLYQAIASGTLRWVGLADRGAGAFDDIVLGLEAQVVAYQLKTSQHPEEFGLRTLLLGEAGLWEKIVDSWLRLTSQHHNIPVEVVYATDDVPRSHDRIGLEAQVSSQDFLNAHAANRLAWDLSQWRASPFGSFVDELFHCSKLEEVAFLSLWRNLRFVTSGDSRGLGFGVVRAPDANRLKRLAAALPELIATERQKDRWTRSELMSRLEWRDVFTLKHSHAFPVSAFYETNEKTQAALEAAIASHSKGYLSLLGPPGSGKSTMLANGLRPTSKLQIVNYLAYLPSERHGLGRAEASSFLHDLVVQFKQLGHGEDTFTGTDLSELRAQLEELLGEAGERYATEGIVTLVVVDGLDHVPREEQPGTSLLKELPQPQSLPEGVLILLGSQRLDLPGLPPAVQDEAQAESRNIVVAPLSAEAVIALASDMGLPVDVNRKQLFSRTAGHPLSTRYAMEALLALDTAEERENWLESGPAYEGDIEAYYQAMWSDLQGDDKAKEALSFLAFSEGFISPKSLDRLVGEVPTDAAWRAARHLILRNSDLAWSVFHNSFRLYLLEQCAMRHGVRDGDRVAAIYTKLAEQASTAEAGDPQRWLELRYRARAGDHLRVANIATSAEFRAQFLSGRSIEEIRIDSNFALNSAVALRSPELVFSTILARTEISKRCEALGDNVFEAYIELGDDSAAQGMIDGASGYMTSGKTYELVDAYLRSGAISEATKLFRELEPVAILTGSEAFDAHGGLDELRAWARRALAFIRPAVFVDILEKLHSPVDRLGMEFNLPGLQETLKIDAATGQIGRNIHSDTQSLMSELRLSEKNLPYLLCFTAFRSKLQGDLPRHIACLHLASHSAHLLSERTRRDAALESARSSRLDMAHLFFDGVSEPEIFDSACSDLEKSQECVRQIILDAELRTWLHDAKRPSMISDTLPARFDSGLRTVGYLMGRARRGGTPVGDALSELKAIMNVFERDGVMDAYNTERWGIDRVLDVAVGATVHAAGMHGVATFSSFTKTYDAALRRPNTRLGQPAVRRAYAEAAFQYDNDAEALIDRVGYQRGLAHTPQEQSGDAAEAAKLLAKIGQIEAARTMLEAVHEESLGYDLPAKKDPQYSVWAEVFERANSEQPSKRSSRMKVFAKLISGLSETEGRDAAGRLVSTMVREAVKGGSAMASAVIDLADETGRADWGTIVSSVSTAVAEVDPELATSAAAVWGRIGLPFAAEHIASPFPELIRSASGLEMQPITEVAVRCVETDAPQKRRIADLHEIAFFTTKYGKSIGNPALTRWREELPTPRSGSSPEDPFYLVETCAGIVHILRALDAEISKYGATRAFVKLLPNTAYLEAKAAFEEFSVLRDDARCIDALATRAFHEGDVETSRRLLKKLETATQQYASWGNGWSSDAKLRYHRLNVLISGEPARVAAFNGFVQDMILGYETADRLIPFLTDVFELFDVRLPWVTAWDLLSEHLTEYREYRMGSEVNLIEREDCDLPAVFADLMFRGVQTMATELVNMIRVLSVELLEIPVAHSIVRRLVDKLLAAGASYGSEAAQIIWEGRHAGAARAVFDGLVPKLIDSDDIYVRHIGLHLNGVWDLGLTQKHREVPKFYDLSLPESEEAYYFDPPPGFSDTSSGVVTDNSYALTWPLQQALEITAKASDFSLPQLRLRAATLMQRSGGISAFGSQQSKAQHDRLGRLELQMPWRKLAVAAAFTAMREVIGELDSAGAIDRDALPVLLAFTSSFPLGLTSCVPNVRPKGILTPKIERSFSQSDLKEWLTLADKDLILPKLPGSLIVAAVATSRCQSHRAIWSVDQYYGPGEAAASTFQEQFSLLPSVIPLEHFIPRYEGVASGGVVRISCMSPGNFVFPTLCPVLLKKLGWQHDPCDPFTFLDAKGAKAGATVIWRDGGVRTNFHEARVCREGAFLAIDLQHVEVLNALALSPRVITSWRTHSDNGKTTISIASRNVKSDELQLL
ncbi:ATP-binding protein [Asticcacaulis sp.]|uniref:ATP-binding protein n=1 Tax=Asticcacaulis sp. TaxID=1872648 RepID=UPI00262E9689|nr:ATP-binding protein [Asticcacaulis sp.]